MCDMSELRDSSTSALSWMVLSRDRQKMGCCLQRMSCMMLNAEREPGRDEVILQRCVSRVDEL
jgi:hypothetical protein